MRLILLRQNVLLIIFFAASVFSSCVCVCGFIIYFLGICVCVVGLYVIPGRWGGGLFSPSL